MVKFYNIENKNPQIELELTERNQPTEDIISDKDKSSGLEDPNKFNN
jgi:hypothetical protein